MNLPMRYEVEPGWGALPSGWSFVEVAGVAVDARDRVFVFNRGEHPVIIFDRAGNFLTLWGEGVFTRPHGLTIGPDDAVYCTDDIGHSVRKFTPDGEPLWTLGHARPTFRHRGDQHRLPHDSSAGGAVSLSDEPGDWTRRLLVRHRRLRQCTDSQIRS